MLADVFLVTREHRDREAEPWLLGPETKDVEMVPDLVVA
jgi:hypothetical protein